MSKYYSRYPLSTSKLVNLISKANFLIIIQLIIVINTNNPFLDTIGDVALTSLCYFSNTNW